MISLPFKIQRVPRTPYLILVTLFNEELQELCSTIVGDFGMMVRAPDFSLPCFYIFFRIEIWHQNVMYV